MVTRTKLKENIEITTREIVDFLKFKGLYISDNGIEKRASNIRDLKSSNSNSISWIKLNSYNIESLKSPILIVGANFKPTSKYKTIIYTKNPRLSITLIIKEFFLEERGEYISNLASIDKSVKIGRDCIINENVVIGENCTIGDRVTIYPDVTIYPNTIIDSEVIINAGTRIGQEGFGYIADMDNELIQFPHLGRVIIKRGVEIGANVSIDRGALSDTIIGEGTKINNLTHIAHNVEIGKGCQICSKVNISGSSKIGDGVYIAPNVSIIDGVTIASGVTIGIGAVIRKDIEKKSTIVTFDGFEKREYIRIRRKLKA